MMTIRMAMMVDDCCGRGVLMMPILIIMLILAFVVVSYLQINTKKLMAFVRKGFTIMWLLITSINIKLHDYYGILNVVI